MRFFDFLFLRPLFMDYFIERIRYFITINIALKGMSLITFTKQQERMIGLVFKYPYVQKIIIKQSLFSEKFPSFLIKYQHLAKASEKHGS